jgi:hypothetical protein
LFWLGGLKRRTLNIEHRTSKVEWKPGRNGEISWEAAYLIIRR